MRLKEIKPGMVIHCTNKEHVKYLFMNNIAESYLLNKKLPVWVNTDGGWMPEIDDEGVTGKHYYESEGYECVEFSDLILPELTAEEVLKIVDDICETKSYNEKNCSPNCPFCHGIFCRQWMAEHPTETVEICAQWKSDHEKKEPEIETVDICRIIEVLPDGRKRCAHEEDMASGSTDAEIKILVESELKRYCMEHDGEFIAVHEVVSRVKR